jgi:hypothetical protein
MYNILKHFYVYYNGTPWSSQFYVRYIWCSGSIVDCIWVVYVGSSPGGAGFETFQLYQRSSTFVKICQKSSIFMETFST